MSLRAFAAFFISSVKRSMDVCTCTAFALSASAASSRSAFLFSQPERVGAEEEDDDDDDDDDEVEEEEDEEEEEEERKKLRGRLVMAVRLGVTSRPEASMASICSCRAAISFISPSTSAC